MMLSSLRQCNRRIAGAAVARRAQFSTVGRERPTSALVTKRRELALARQIVTKRSYAIAAEDTDKGVVRSFRRWLYADESHHANTIW